MRWQAPELFLIDMDTLNTDGGNTFATDVYAFAMVCYEVSRITSHQEIHLNTALDVFWDTPFS